jgi:hypothetical protein
MSATSIDPREEDVDLPMVNGFGCGSKLGGYRMQILKLFLFFTISHLVQTNLIGENRNSDPIKSAEFR